MFTKRAEEKLKSSKIMWKKLGIVSKVSEEKNGNILLSILIERKRCDDEWGQSWIRMYRKLKKKIL